ncbi:MAG: restriction endonuclease subunit S [Clostridium sp.]|nr:restriction endonuclease subunit S [Clostridium sp.]
MARLGDVCTKGTSNIAQKDLEGHGGNYPIYGASGFIANVDFYQQENPYIAVVKDGAGIGRIMKLPAKSSVIGTMQYIIPDDTVDISYLAYAMEHMNLSKYFTGATIPHIYFKDYQKEELPLPCLDEQRKIAAVLDKVSDLIAKRQQQLDKLNEAVKARFVEIFGEPDENPKHWQEDELSHHLKVIGGYAFKSDGFTDEGIPVLRIGNINSGHFLPVNMVYWPDDLALARYKVFPGDLVMSLTGTVGKDDYGNVCILGADYDEYYLNQRNAKLSIEKSLNKCYFSELLKFPRIKKRLTGISRGIRQANISNKDILTLRVPMPPIELQEQFAAFVEQTEKTKIIISHSLEKLETLKKALMQEYFG